MPRINLVNIIGRVEKTIFSYDMHLSYIHTLFETRPTTVIVSNREKPEAYQDGDIVQVKGVLKTTDITDKIICECGSSMKRDPINITTIEPIDIAVISGDIHLSCDIQLFGALISPPRKISDTAVRYRIVANRKYKIEPDVKTDVFVVESHGKQAIKDIYELSYRSQVLIEGSVQINSCEQPIICQACKNMYTYQLDNLVIVPDNIIIFSD